MGVCKIEVCDRDVYVKIAGLCSAHYARSKKNIPLNTAIRTRVPYPTPWEAIHRRKPSWRLNAQGYVSKTIRISNAPHKTRVLLQHREIMAEYLGRSLLETENVHHRNGVRNDNRIENLELWVSPQPCGQRPEDLVVYAWEVLDRYGHYAPPPKNL